MRLMIATAASLALVGLAFSQEPKEKGKQEPAPATADSQQGFSMDYCRDLLAKKGSNEQSAGASEAKIKSCMSTGKIE